MKKYWERLKAKWGIETDRRMVVIFIVFAITGSATLFVRKALFSAFNIDIDHKVLAIIVKWVSIYFIYQIMLFIIGTIFKEGKFFWWFIKKMNLRMIGKKPTK
ncbi:MAG: diacylglyceryl transferase [Bacteroidetes bacterium]|nr:diacylglyceryl transferase [Bacteroidota bacterium]